MAAHAASLLATSAVDLHVVTGLGSGDYLAEFVLVERSLQVEANARVVDLGHFVLQDVSYAHDEPLIFLIDRSFTFIRFEFRAIATGLVILCNSLARALSMEGGDHGLSFSDATVYSDLFFVKESLLHITLSTELPHKGCRDDRLLS